MYGSAICTALNYPWQAGVREPGTDVLVIDHKKNSQRFALEELVY